MVVSVQDYELDMLPGSERKLESSLKDVQTKLEVVKQLQPLWLRSCLPLVATTATTACYHHQTLVLVFG